MAAVKTYAATEAVMMLHRAGHPAPDKVLEAWRKQSEKSAPRLTDDEMRQLSQFAANFPIVPDLEYGGTSGWAGSDTSRSRAEKEDSGGVTGKRQQRVIRLLAQAGRRGRTWKEIADSTGWHHGQVTSALSGLHKAGRIARLSERRHNSKVYVLHEHVEGRTVEPYGRSRPTSEAVQAAETERGRIADLLEESAANYLRHGDRHAWSVLLAAAAQLQQGESNNDRG